MFYYYIVHDLWVHGLAFVKRNEHMATKPLKRLTTDELETAIYSGSLDNIQRYEAERILSDRERVPERRLTRRTYNAAAWALAFSMGILYRCPGHPLTFGDG